MRYATKALLDFLPREKDQEWIKIEKRFEMLYIDSKNEAVKSRLAYKKRLFMTIMRVMVSIRKLRYKKKNDMKISRENAYLLEKRSLTTEDIVPQQKNKVVEKDIMENSFDAVDQ